MENFDFNAVQQPTMQITLPDKERTKIVLTMPSTSLVERLDAVSDELNEIFAKKDISTIHQVYQLLAEILSCNQDFREFTAEELKKCLSFDHIVAFCLAYIKFLGGIKKAKN
ncbi:MAG: hypothetical protein K2H89_07610 [Oscillospiraceae bacterium]|nr:hypothetical protein [Oscillospiraceae bacterium]